LVKTFNGISDSSGITDLCSSCGRPHNVNPTANINKVKDLALISARAVSLYPRQDLSSVKNILSKRFSTYFFIYIHLIICLSMVNLIAVITLTDVRFASLLAKNFKKNINYFMLLESAFH